MLQCSPFTPTGPHPWPDAPDPASTRFPKTLTGLLAAIALAVLAALGVKTDWFRGKPPTAGFPASPAAFLLHARKQNNALALSAPERSPCGTVQFGGEGVQPRQTGRYDVHVGVDDRVVLLSRHVESTRVRRVAPLKGEVGRRPAVVPRRTAPRQSGRPD